MAFTATDVKNLREQTGCGMMDCKKALTESNGDFEKAVEYLREKGLAAAAKKAGRIAAEGMVFAEADMAKKVGVVIEVNAETDFVAKNELFRTFVQDLAQIVINENPADVDALVKCEMGDGDVGAALKEKILVIGENIKIRRFERFEGVCAAYVHGGGSIGVIVKFNLDGIAADNAEFAECAHNVALQCAAMNATYANKEDVPQSALDEEKEVLMTQIANDPKNANKPAQIIEKMVQGRLGKFYETYCLAEQAYVKDDSMTVAKYIDSVAKNLGGKLAIDSFVRFEKGEGLQKREDNLAEEVAKMTAGN